KEKHDRDVAGLRQRLAADRPLRAADALRHRRFRDPARRRPKDISPATRKTDRSPWHKDFMPLTWRPRMDETWGRAAR
ncbi:MAG TPA: hypothetical protein VGD83_13200, partial [Streptosporangiaceae bacterium]